MYLSKSRLRYFLSSLQGIQVLGQIPSYRLQAEPILAGIALSTERHDVSTAVTAIWAVMYHLLHADAQ